VDKRALISGAAGFVSRQLAAYLVKEGLEIHGIDLPSVLPPRDWPGYWYPGDVTDAKRVFTIVREVEPDYVFHLAALNKNNSLGDLLTINVIGTQNVLDALLVVRPKASILITGSSAECGLARPEELPIREGNPLRPLSPYGISKLAQSLLAAQYFYRHGLSVLRSRTFNLTGPGEPDTLVCSSFARQIAEIERGLSPLVLKVGNLNSTRDFVDVRDAVRAYWLIAQFGEPGKIYNVCSGVPTSIQEILNILLEVATVKPLIQEIPELQTAWDVPVQVGCFELLHETLGWKQEIPLVQSLRDNLNSWRAHLS